MALNRNNVAWKVAYLRHLVVSTTAIPTRNFTAADSFSSGVPSLFTISYHLGTPYRQRLPLLPEQLI